MSLLRGIWNDGQAINTPEQQRPIDVSAAADDRVFELLFTPGANQKKVIPLIEESLTIIPRLLVLPGVTNGTVKVQPCQLIAGDATNAQAVDLSANLQTALQSALVGANSSGSTRIDLLYATVSRSVPAAIGSPPAGSAYAGIGLASTGTGAQQSRSIKDVSSGSVSTQTINIYDVPTVALTILAGTPGGGAPSLPADSASAFNFSLATLTIATGYTSGAAITQSLITPLWTGGYVPSGRVRLIRHGSLVDKAPGTTGKATTPLSDRWPSVNRMVIPVVVTATSQTITLDDSIDWRQRIITIRAMRPFSDGTNTAMKALENTGHIPGVNVNVTFGPAVTTGLAGSSGQIIGSDGTPYWQFKMGSGGGTALVAVYQTQVLLSGTAASDVWWFDIDYTDQFVF